MSPILGIWASQISGHLWAPEGAYDALATVTVPSGGAASISFVGIPSGYKHLQIRGIARSNRASTRDALKVTVNGNSSNFTYHNLYGEGTTVVGQAYTSQAEMVFNDISGANATSGVFGVMVIDLLDYASTSKYKTIRALGGSDNNTSGLLGLNSGFYSGNTNAITSITLQAYIGTGLADYSQFALYGVK
jgi:hypothetical protein